jgi:sarcosine oxidase subunit gamma
MADPGLSPRKVWDDLVIPEGDGVALKPSPLRHRLVFQARPHELDARMRAAGLGASPAILRALTAGGASLLHLGPDEWLLISEAEMPPKWHEIAGSGAIEITHGYAGIEWVGPRVLLALSAGCPLDLHESAFPTGMVTRTLYGKCEVMLWRQERERFHMDVPRSYLAAMLAFFGETIRHLPSS